MEKRRFERFLIDPIRKRINVGQSKTKDSSPSSTQGFISLWYIALVFLTNKEVYFNYYLCGNLSKTSDSLGLSLFLTFTAPLFTIGFTHVYPEFTVWRLVLMMFSIQQTATTARGSVRNVRPVTVWLIICV